MDCPHCSSASTYHRAITTKRAYKCYHCRNSGKFFNACTLSPFNRLCHKTELIFKAVFFRLHYKLSLRDLVELFETEGISLSHETIRLWEAKFGPLVEKELKNERKGTVSSSWHADETLIKVKKEWHYLYRATHSRGQLVEAKLARTRNLATTTTTAFFKVAVEIVGQTPHKVTTDKDKESSYPGAIEAALGRKVEHRSIKYLNNKLEQDHRGIKSWVKPMPGFKSPTSAARFCRAFDFDEQRHYFRPRKFLIKPVNLMKMKKRVHLGGQYLRLKSKFLGEKLHWQQTLLRGV